MHLYTDNGGAMSNALNAVYGSAAMLIENALFAVASDASRDYLGGTWAFVTNDWETLGFWYPTSRDTYAVACQNYFDHAAMDARSFGAACTLVALNQTIWRMHAAGMPVDHLSEQFHELRHWVFDLGEGAESFIDTAAVAGFID